MAYNDVVQSITNAIKDALTLDDVVNGEPNTQAKSRLGRLIYSLATINHRVDIATTQANQKLTDLDNAINAAAAAGAGANGWIADLVVDGDKTQKELNKDFKSLTKTKAISFVDFLTSIDAAQFIQSYANSLRDGDTLLIPSGKWALKSPCIINKAVNIKCDGELVVSGDLNSVFKLMRDPVHILSGSDLTQLPKKGDTKLHIANTSLFNSAEYFFTLSSTEVEIVRIGYSSPYYKNETLDFIDSNFNLRGQIDLDYNDASKLTIKLFKKSKPTSVQLRLSMQPNAGQTTDARILEAEGVNNIVWDVDIDRSNSKLISGISFKYANCVHFTFMPQCRISGGQSDNGDSYAFLNVTSSYILNFGIGYFDSGNSSKKERGYAARHGKYVYFDACALNGIDDHYGHHYVIQNMDFLNRGIGISGGSVYIKNCKQYSDLHPLMSLRTDTPYADGDLTIENCYAKAVLLSTTANNDPTYNSKYKAWDNVSIDKVKVKVGASHCINLGVFFDQNSNYPTERFTIRDLEYDRSVAGARLVSGGTTVAINNIVLDNIFGKDAATTQLFHGFYAANRIDLRNMPDGIDGKWVAPVISIDNTKLGHTVNSSVLLLASSSLNISHSHISDDCGSYQSAATQGNITLVGNRISGFRFFANEALKLGVVAAYGNTVEAQISFDGDLRNYQKNKPFRYLQAQLALGTLAVGAVSPVQTVTVLGARVGDPIDSAVTTNSKGLRVNAWVSANDTVQYYVENPAGNPNGSQTFASIAVRITVRSN